MEIVQKQLNATSEDKEKESTASSEIEQSLDESLLVPVETPVTKFIQGIKNFA